VGIFDFLKNLFRREVEPQPPSATQPTPTGIIKKGGNLARLVPPKPGRFSQDPPLQKLLNQVKGKGHPKYPFLHQEYSPNSRIPCADFTPFIIERLRVGDESSINALMKGIIEANPGLGTDAGWIVEEVKDVLRAPLEKYHTFADPAAYLHLRAMWIIAGKGGGGREFWLTTLAPQFFAQALSPFEMELKPTSEELLKKANRFIREMRKDAPYWLDFPLFKVSELQVPPLPSGEGLKKVRHLTIGARLHLFSAVEAGGGILSRLTGYELRGFGLNIFDSCREIIKSGLLIPSQDPGLLKHSMSKTELLETCIKAGVTYRKSWNKEKLIQSLLGASPKYMEQIIDDSQVVALNPDDADCLRALLARAQQIKSVFQVLCFA
jgi:hypothetical protein